MTRPAAFTQGDISKLLKGAKAAGLTVSRVTIDATGKIVADFAQEGDNASKPDDEWGARIRAKTQQPSTERH
jgi:hypothetical protein